MITLFLGTALAVNGAMMSDEDRLRAIDEGRA